MHFSGLNEREISGPAAGPGVATGCREPDVDAVCLSGGGGRGRGGSGSFFVSVSCAASLLHSLG